MPTFSDYHDFYAQKMVGHPLGDDFLKLLTWLEDRSGDDIGYSDIAMAVAGDADLADRALFERVMPLTVIMTTWAEPIANPFFVVQDAAGVFHEAGQVSQDVISGKEPFSIPSTGEVIQDFPAKAYMRFRIADFEPAVQPSAPRP